MKFHKQRFLHDPDNGQYGDCHRTAIACILDLELDDVPHFLYDNCDGNEFDRREREFLSKRGLIMINIPFAGTLDEVLQSIKHNSPGAVFLLAGKSPRGTCHSVVCFDGKIIHDPHPDGGGVVAPCSDYWWAQFLSPVIKVNHEKFII